MNLIRRSSWVFLLLGAMAGCSGEEGANTSGNPAPPSPSLAPSTPAPPPPTKTEGTKEEPSKEMQPAPAKTGEGEMKKGEDLPKIEGPKSETPTKGEAAAAKLSADEVAAIKQLPAGEQEIALKQVVCPVSGEHLGEMGKPFKVAVEGRNVFLCCEGCEEKIKADPKKYLAKVDGSAKK